MRGNCDAKVLAPVTVPGTDDYGDPVAAPAGSADVELVGCVKAPRSSEERRTERSPAVITGLTLYVPGDQGAAILPSSLLEVDGERWEVEGEPGQWVSPFVGRRRGVEVALARWEQP